MSRPLRMEFAGAFYHVTSRGDQRGSIFVSDHDRTEFLVTLARVVELYGWRIHAWCKMTNHYHLLVETPAPNLCRGMQQLNGQYSGQFNRANRRVGHVFQGRYKAIFIERESYLLEVARYVVLNPVRASMVRSAAEWPWSSYRDTADHREGSPWLTSEVILGQFATQRSTAVTAYRAFIAAGKDQPAPWSALRNEIYLGSEQFVHGLLALVDEQVSVRDTPKVQRRALSRPLDEYVEQYRERDDAITAAYCSGSYTLRQLEAHFGVHYSRVSRIIRARRGVQAKDGR